MGYTGLKLEQSVPHADSSAISRQRTGRRRRTAHPVRVLQLRHRTGTADTRRTADDTVEITLQRRYVSATRPHTQRTNNTADQRRSANHTAELTAKIYILH